jgi:hypothetical protein
MAEKPIRSGLQEGRYQSIGNTIVQLFTSPTFCFDYSRQPGSIGMLKDRNAATAIKPGMSKRRTWK